MSNAAKAVASMEPPLIAAEEASLSLVKRSGDVLAASVLG